MSTFKLLSLGILSLGISSVGFSNDPIAQHPLAEEAVAAAPEEAQVVKEQYEALPSEDK